jgi:hypothetical protein
VALKAQLVKLEAKKTKAAAQDQISFSSLQKDMNGQGYLELAFGEQANQIALAKPMADASATPEASPEDLNPVETGAAAAMPAEPDDGLSPETGIDPETVDISSGVEAPEPVCPAKMDAPPEDEELV